MRAPVSHPRLLLVLLARRRAGRGPSGGRTLGLDGEFAFGGAHQVVGGTRSPRLTGCAPGAGGDPWSPTELLHAQLEGRLRGVILHRGLSNGTLTGSRAPLDGSRRRRSSRSSLRRRTPDERQPQYWKRGGAAERKGRF